MEPFGREQCHGRFLLVTATLLLLLTSIPSGVSASTPPLLPELVLSVPGGTLHPDEDLAVSVIWNGEGSPYLPPDAVRVLLYSVSEERLVGTYLLLSETLDEPGDTARHYSGVIHASELPGGEIVFTAVDPISGAERHTSIYRAEPGADYGDLQRGRFGWYLFAGTMLLLAFGLIAALRILVRQG